MTIDIKAKQLFLSLPLAAQLMIQPLTSLLIPTLATQIGCKITAVSEQSVSTLSQELTYLVRDNSFSSEIERVNQTLTSDNATPQENEYTLNLTVLVDQEARNFLGESWQTKIQQAIDYSNIEFATLRVDDKKPIIKFRVQQYRIFASDTNDGLVILKQLLDKFKAPKQTLVVYFTGRDITGVVDGNVTNRVVGYAYMPGNHCVIEVLYKNMGSVVVHEEGHTLSAPHVEIAGSHMHHYVDSTFPDGTRRFDEQSRDAIYKAIEAKPSILDLFRYIPTMIGYVWNNYVPEIISDDQNKASSNSPKNCPVYVLIISPLEKIWIEEPKPDNPKNEKYQRKATRWPHLRDMQKPTSQHMHKTRNFYLARSRI